MKTNFFILFICILPLLLSGTNLKTIPLSNEVATGLISPYEDIVQNTQSGFMKLPMQGKNSERNWRLMGNTYQTDEDLDNVFQINGIAEIHYNPINSTQIDSVVYSRYDSTAFTYTPFKTKKYYYAANGEDLVRSDVINASSSPGSYWKYIYEYDDQHRLIHQNLYSVQSNGTVVIQSRYHWIINNDMITDWFQVHFEYSAQPTEYVRTSYLHDAQGRNTGYLRTYCSDSLNWVNDGNCVITYNPSDTSTGQNMIDSISRLSPLQLFSVDSNIVPIPYNMFSENITRYWTNNTWENSAKIVCTYNNNNNLQSWTRYYYDDDWWVYDRYIYDYDTNGNLSQVSYQTWYNAINNWAAYSKIDNLSWEEMTPNADETTNEALMELSAYPNPFNNEIHINLNSKNNASFEAGIYNIKGQLIKQFNKQKSKSFTWDGKDNDNLPTANGIYLIKVNQNGHTASQKIIKVN